jgi:phospholipase C
MCGQADPESGRDDALPPIYALPSFLRYLDAGGVDWRWYSFDPGTLRAADPEYRLSHHDRFGYVDARKLSIAEEVVGKLTEKGSFLDDVAAGKLPAVSWIDPHFKDLRVLGPDSNDDHPPSDVLAGQDLVLTVYHALSANAKTWPKTLLIITYDEHGGFYDHVAPPDATDDHPDFQRHGVRVPALLVSPLVEPGSTASQLLGEDICFDHTSIMKTIFTCFCQRDGQIPAMSTRAAASQHLGHLLRDAPAQATVPDHSDEIKRLTAWRDTFVTARFENPVALAAPPRELTDFQNGFYEMARRLRHAGLPAGHP